MKVFVLAGEASGDLLGADFITAFQREESGAEFRGAGGPRMRSAGQDQSVDLAAHAVIGVGEVLRHYPKFRAFFYQLLDEAEEWRPDLVVLIDNPGFNLRFLPELKRRCPAARVVYLVSPQLWAWKPERARILERHVDLLLCIFPFEPDWYAAHAPRLRVAWIGHPILDRLAPADDSPGPSPDARVALMAGSRKREVERHLPILIDAAERMHSVQPRLQFLALAPSEEMADLERRIIERRAGFRLDIPVRVGYAATHVSRIHLALVSSGTATLECAVAGAPMVILYKVNPITFAIAQKLVKVPYLGIVNLLLNEEAVPELIQDNANPALLARTALEILADPARANAQRARLAEAVRLLGCAGASRRAARIVGRLMRKEPLRGWGEDELLGDRS